MRYWILILCLFVVVGCDGWHRNHAGHPHDEVIGDPAALFCYEATFVDGVEEEDNSCFTPHFVLESDTEVLFVNAEDLLNLLPDLTEEGGQVCLGPEDFELLEYFFEDKFDCCDEDEDRGHGND